MNIVKKNLLINTESVSLKSPLSSIWDIKNPYWYPLVNCNREDIIAFDLKYVESNDKIELIRKLLKECGDTLKTSYNPAGGGDTGTESLAKQIASSKNQSANNPYAYAWDQGGK